MDIEISRSVLKGREAQELTEETRKSQHIGLINPKIWRQFKTVYIARINGNLAGVCVVVPLERWIKIGPVLVLEKFQGQGIGSLLVRHVVGNYPKSNLYTGSSNIRIKTTVTKLGFKTVSLLKLPWKIKIYLLSYLFQRCSIDYLIDAVVKKVKYKRGKYCFFLRRC